MKRSEAVAISGGVIGIAAGLTMIIAGFVIGGNIALAQVNVLTDMVANAVSNATAEICADPTAVQNALIEANTSLENGAATTLAITMGGALVSMIGASFFATGMAKITDNNSEKTRENDIQINNESANLNLNF